MTLERWRQISQLYRAVLAQEADRQVAFLADACGADVELRATVEHLLNDQETAGSFLGAPMLEEIASALIEPDAVAAGDMAGRRLGQYRICDEIGRGGMGVVYLADRIDDIFRKRVAIKVVRPGFAGGNIVTRFRQEREILASLDHPAIARILDGGSTDDGLPYLVMEYVDGQPIDTWCDQRKMDVRRRLELFREVCAGVQHAHDRLVLHRDLKPANILVTADGGVKVLDFGIAKLIGGGGALAPVHTTSSARMMTPTYASPEQVRGNALSITSDVYALGVVLYELLTGRWPYRTHSALPHEIAWAVCESEPTAPSTMIGMVEEAPAQADAHSRAAKDTVSELRGTTPDRLHRQLAGDLDAILLKVLDKDPARRYHSVEQFSEDVRRHLDGLAVTARRDTYWYRVSTFLRRHRVVVAASMLIAIVQQVSFLTTIWEIRVKVPAALAAGSLADVRPELVSLSYLAVALLVGTVYVSRARLWRATGSIAGGTIFAVFVALVPTAMGWRRFVGLRHPNQSLLLLYVIGVLYGAIIALVGWRVARRFGWRGLAALVIVVSIGGPLRERLYLSAAHIEVVAPGITPWIANTFSWVCALLTSHGVMRLMAGPARSDGLARWTINL